ncbi:MAG: peptide chain release factor N(5)-glutamine methyltransferase [Smithella sp.]
MIKNRILNNPTSITISEMLVRDILNETARNLAIAGIPSPRLDAEVLLAFCLDRERLDFIKNPDEQVSEQMQASFQNLVTRRLAWEPVAYLTGHKEFWSFVLEVNSSVLIPRPDTEVLVEEALKIYNQQSWSRISILDIGTGSGAIALALASEIPHALLTATDISATALATARRNAIKLNLDHRINFQIGNLFEPIHDLFDMIVSNPPYIAEEDYDKLPAGVKDYEPAEALQAGPGGLFFYQKIIMQALDYLKEDGWLLLEIGAAQGDQVHNILETSGQYCDIGITNDYAGLQRVIKARRKKSG